MSQSTVHGQGVRDHHWLGRYYATRAAVAATWVALAFTAGRRDPVAAALLIAYPAWDALANGTDARRNGGLSWRNSQTLNLVVSSLTAVAMAFAVARGGASGVLQVFGVWAILAGLLQLVTGVRRWKAGAQWAMVLSGAQSALAGGFFLSKAHAPQGSAIAVLAPYAGVGAFYFLVSAVWLAIGERRRKVV